MSATLESFLNPNYLCFKTPSSSSSSSSMAVISPPPAASTPRFFTDSLLPTQHTYTLSLVSRSVFPLSPSPAPAAFGLLPLRRRPCLRYPSFAASQSHEESPIDIEVEKEKTDLKAEAAESQEAWKETLASFREQALKIQSVSQEAYELYSKKAMIILKETADQLKIQADKAREDLTVLAKEIGKESKDYLSVAAEKSPEVKDIVETFATSTDELNELSKVRDFYVGIPYGALLSIGGFLSFMLSGSISAIRFGVVLGGTLLALSISSLRSWKKGELSPLALKGQAVIASILFLRETLLLFVRASFPRFITTIVSGALAAFYVYRIRLDGKQVKGSNVEPGKES